jgi:hypothetical protein
LNVWYSLELMLIGRLCFPQKSMAVSGGILPAGLMGRVGLIAGCTLVVIMSLLTELRESKPT